MQEAERALLVRTSREERVQDAIERFAIGALIRRSGDGLRRARSGGPRPWLVLAALAAVLYPSASVRATTAPAPGQEFPSAYVEFRTAHPEMFIDRGGLQSMVDRAKARRDLFLADVTSVRVVPGTGKVVTDLGETPRESLAVTGTINIPVIPVQFSPNTTPTPPTAARIAQILFAGPNPPYGTAHDYYNEVSYGLVNLTGTVLPYTTLPIFDAYYEGGSNGLPTTPGSGDKVGRLMKDALDALDLNTNFGQFDNDGPDRVPNSGDDDGVVDLISFIHPEKGGECGGGSANIWAHRWVYSGWNGAPYSTNDNWTGHQGQKIKIDDYSIQGALTCAGTEMQIGTFCHEIGHVFGLPDLYDIDKSPPLPTTAPSQGDGYWTLMAGGNWNTQDSPAHLSAWEKSKLGWLFLTLHANPAPNVAIPQVETNASALQIPLGGGEMFLIENRQPVGFDRNLKTCGLAIWHTDQTVLTARTPSNSVNTNQSCGAIVQSAGKHYGLALVQADGQCHLEGNVNRGDSGDLFPGSTNNRSFTSLTNPNSNRYAGPTSVSVTSISNCAATMTANIAAVPQAPQAAAAVDVAFLIDNTGTYVDDWPNIQAQMLAVVQKLQNNFADIRFGLATFRDYPDEPFGTPGDVVYQQLVPFSANNSAAFLNAVAAMEPPGGGGDLPEAQYEALYQLLTGAGRDLDGDGVSGNDPGETAPSSMGWQRKRVVYLMTDGPFQDADTGDYPTGTSHVPAPTLEYAGRGSVRSVLADWAGDLTIFVLVSEQPGAYITQGAGGAVPNMPQTELQQQAHELTDATAGSVLSVGTDSSDLGDAIDISVDVLKNNLVVAVPMLGPLGGASLALLLLLLLTLYSWRRYQTT